MEPNYENLNKAMIEVAERISRAIAEASEVLIRATRKIIETLKTIDWNAIYRGLGLSGGEKDALENYIRRR